MPVRQMLASLTSEELTEWRAYERKNGPLDNVWRDEAQSNLVDLIRQLLYLTSQAHFGNDGKKAVQGPVEMPKKKYTRPWYLHYPEPDEEPEAIEEQDARQVEMLNAALNARAAREAKMKKKKTEG